MKTKKELQSGGRECRHFEILDIYVEVYAYCENEEYVVELITHDIVQVGMECELKNGNKYELRTKSYAKAKKEFDKLCKSASIMENNSTTLVAFQY